mgnify:FL=1
MRIARNVKQPEQVEVLSMNVTKDFDWCLQIEQHWFRVEHLDDLVDEELNGLLVEFYWLAPDTTLHFDKLRDYRVDGDITLHIILGRDKLDTFLVLVFNLCYLSLADVELRSVVSCRQTVLIDCHMLQKICD